MQAGIEQVFVEPDIARYCVDIATATRSHSAIEVGSSPRGSQGLMLVARALAVIDGRDFVAPEDIKRVAVPVLAHRLSLTTQAWANGTRAADVVSGIVAEVAGPADGRTALRLPRAVTDTSAQTRHRVSATTIQRWTLSPGLAAGAVTALVLASIGLIAGRIDLALLSLPLVVAVALSWDQLPRPDEHVTVTLSLADPGESEVAYSLDVRSPPEAEIIVLRCSVLGGESRELAVSGPLTDELVGLVPLLHSGPQEIVRFDYRFLASDAAAASLPQDPIIGEYVVAPGQATIHSLPLPRRLQGMTGPHDSARAGDGGEFRDVHPVHRR